MKVAFHIGESLSRNHTVHYINARKSVFSPAFWMKLVKLKPDIVHVFLRPTVVTLSLAQLFKLVSNRSKVVFSAVQPPLHFATGVFFSVKPDLVLVQSKRTQQLFDMLGYKTAWLPNGVDIDKFHSVSKKEKTALRKKYSVGPDQFVVLHVGHITKGRNLGVFREIAKQENTRVIIISSTLLEPDAEVWADLTQSGCTIWRKFFPHIEEIYQLADCYVFPVQNQSNCIELPLSIMEAMACNLPVLTSNFGGTHQLFKEGTGLVFVHRTNLIQAFNKLKKTIQSNNFLGETRNQILNFTWETIGAQLEQIYRSLYFS